MEKFLPYANQNFDRKSDCIIIGLGFSNKYEIAEIVTLLNSSILATKWVIQSSPLALIGFWIPYNGRATGVPPVTVRGLDHRTEDHSQSPATQGRNIPYWIIPAQDTSRLGSATAHTKPK